MLKSNQYFREVQRAGEGPKTKKETQGVLGPVSCISNTSSARQQKSLKKVYQASKLGRLCNVLYTIL